jgi:hypothetical protein
MIASRSTYDYGINRPRRNHAVSHAPRRVCNGPTTVYHTCNTSFVLLCKNAKVVARKLGSKCKGDKTCIWVPKVIVTNLVGPNKDSQDSIIFGDGNQGKVKGLGKIAITSEHSISNVFLVESLGYNLLSVSQLCNMGYNCFIHKCRCICL